MLRDGSKDSLVKKDKYRFGREASKLSEDGDADLRKKAMVNNYLNDNKTKRENSDCRKLSTEKSDLQVTASRGNPASRDVSRSNSDCSIFSHDNQDESCSVRKDRTSSMASYQSNNPKRGSISIDTPRTERTVRFSGRVSKMSCVSHHGMSRVCLREAAAEKQVKFVLFSLISPMLLYPKSHILHITPTMSFYNVFIVVQ